MAKQPTPRPLDARQDLPTPLPPKSQIKLFAAQMRNCIERGMNPRTLADLALPAQGEAFVYAASTVTAEEAFQSFKQDPDAWNHLEPVEHQLKPWLERFITRCKELVAEQAIKPPADESCRATSTPSTTPATSPEGIIGEEPRP